MFYFQRAEHFFQTLVVNMPFPVLFSFYYHLSFSPPTAVKTKNCLNSTVTFGVRREVKHHASKNTNHCLTTSWFMNISEAGCIRAQPLHQSEPSVGCLKAGIQFCLKCSEVLVPGRKTESLKTCGRLWEMTFSHLHCEGSCGFLPSNPELHKRLQFITGCYKTKTHINAKSNGT